MNTTAETADPLHAEVLALLPWYLQGALRGDEHERVRRHLAGCAACRGELEDARSTSAAYRALPLRTPSVETGLSRLLADVAAAPKPDRVRTIGPGWRARLADWLRPAPLRSAWAAAALLLVVAGSTLLARHAGDPAAADYRVLSSGRDSQVRAIDEISLVLAPDYSTSQRERLLGSVGGRIVGGPNSVGAYTVRLAGAQSPAQLAELLARLRHQPGVLLAEAANPTAVNAPGPSGPTENPR